MTDTPFKSGERVQGRGIGREVQGRMRLRHASATGFEDFLTGFLVNGDKAFFGRPAGLAMLHDGSMLVSDDADGVIYRVSHGAPAAL